MVMPVKQRCPECGQKFIDSDCIERICDECVLEMTPGNYWINRAFRDLLKSTHRVKIKDWWIRA